MSHVARTSVLVVGAGPAGLGAAAACVDRGCDFLVLETGSRVGRRDHADQRRLGTGVGGSGLYSDGKFSFFPSATALWRLPDRRALRASWGWLVGLLRGFGLEPPAFPDLDALPDLVVGTGLTRKYYPSSYLSRDDRTRMIAALESACAGRLIDGTEAHRLRYEDCEGLFVCEAGAERLTARAVVYAGGRFGPIHWPALFPQGGRTFRRVEVGVRLEQHSDDFFLRDDGCLDPKLLLSAADGRYGFRTFCCCRDGEVVTTEVLGVMSTSGRADCPPTGRSNVGFNLRVGDEALARELWPGGRLGGAPIVRSLDECLTGGPESTAGVLGVGASRLLLEGLRRLRSEYPSLGGSPCRVIAPAVEGVGHYPALTYDLRAAPYPLWVAGDATGVFRGLTAALMSGYYAALRAMEQR
jgi:hypothetical protein